MHHKDREAVTLDSVGYFSAKRASNAQITQPHRSRRLIPKTHLSSPLSPNGQLAHVMV